MTHHYPDDGVECSPPLEGTGFIVGFPPGDNRFGLVTNRHLADLSFFENPEDEGTALKSVKIQWWQSKGLRLEHTVADPRPIYHTDPLIDVAIIPIAAKPGKPIDIFGELYDDIAEFLSLSDDKLVFQHALGWKYLLECESLWEQLEPGEFVAFPGYPEWYDHLQIRPVMRTGMIASDPQTDYRSGDGAPTKRDSRHQVLFDAYSTRGNSGSPVYVAQRSLPQINVVLPTTDPTRPLQGAIKFNNFHRSFLVGVNASHYNDTGILQRNEHAGLSRMHKLSVIMEILRANTSPHSIDASRINMHIPVPTDPKTKARAETAIRDKRIVALYAEGKSLRAIAAEVGCSPRTVGRVIKEQAKIN